jgi:cytochrome c-type biogenesis protein CcmH/NrfG
LNPADVETLYNLASALFNQGLYEEAVEPCRRMLQIDPGWPPAAALFAAVEQQLRNSGGEVP